MNTEKEKTSKYFSGNKFFIVHSFNNDLRDGMVIPLTNKIEELAAQKKPAPLEIYINSHGGDGELCLHIVSLLEMAKSRGVTVRTYVTQVAHSAGSIVAMVGSPGERYISRRAEHCVHYGTQYGWPEHTPLQIDRNTQKKRRWFKTLKQLYEQYAEIPDLDEMLKDDSFFVTAQQAIKWKLADKYMDGGK